MTLSHEERQEIRERHVPLTPPELDEIRRRDSKVGPNPPKTWCVEDRRRLLADYDRLVEVARALSDHLYDGIGWIERGPSGMSIADAERLDQLGDALRALIDPATPEPVEGEPKKRRVRSQPWRPMRDGIDYDSSEQ